MHSWLVWSRVLGGRNRGLQRLFRQANARCVRPLHVSGSAFCAPSTQQVCRSLSAEIITQDGREIAQQPADGLLGAWKLTCQGVFGLDTWAEVNSARKVGAEPLWVHAEFDVQQTKSWLQNLWSWDGIEWVRDALLQPASGSEDAEAHFYNPVTGESGFLLSFRGLDLEDGHEASQPVSLRVLCTDTLVFSCRYHSILKGGTVERKLRDALARAPFKPASTLDVVALLFLDVSRSAWRELEAIEIEVVDIEHQLHGLRVGGAGSCTNLGLLSERLASARFRSACIRRFIMPQHAELGHLVNLEHRRGKNTVHLEEARSKHHAIAQKLEYFHSVASTAQDLLGAARQERTLNILTWIAYGIPVVFVMHEANSWARAYLKHQKTAANDGDLWNDPRHWGMTYAQFKEFESLARAHYGTRFSEVSMRDVVRDLLVPLCAEEGVSYVRSVNATRPKPVQAFVTHCWDESFSEFCNSITSTFQHQLVKPNLFICAFALNQTGCVDAQLGQTIEEAPFVSAMRDASEFVVCRNSKLDLYSRGWCLIEVLYAMKLGLIPHHVHVTGPNTFASLQSTCLDFSCSKHSDKVKILKCLLNEGDAVEIDTRITEFRKFGKEVSGQSASAQAVLERYAGIFERKKTKEEMSSA